MSPKRGGQVGQVADRSSTPWGRGEFGRLAGRYYPHQRFENGAGGGNAVSPDDTFFRPWVVHIDMECSGLGIEVTTAQASGLIRLGLYAASDDTGYPTTLVEDLSTVDASTTGAKDNAFASNRFFKAGEIWWFALQTNDTTIAVNGVAEAYLGSASLTNDFAQMYRDTVSNFAGGLPTTVSPSFISAATFKIMAKAV